MALKKAFIRKLAQKLRRLRHEEHYDQSWWAKVTGCGTAACLAGHAAQMAGWRFVRPDKDDLADGFTRMNLCRIGKRERTVQDAARVALGLPNVEIIALFHPEPWLGWRTFAPEFAKRWGDVQSGISNERPSRIAADLLDAIADGKVKP